MKKILCFCLLTVFVCGAFAAPKKKAPESEASRIIQKTLADFNKRKVPYAQRIEAMWKLLEEAPFATDELSRLEGYRQICDWCKVPAWNRLGLWDWSLKEKYYPRLMPLVLESRVYSAEDKVPFVAANARLLGDREDYDGTIAWVKAQIAKYLPQIKKSERRAQLKRVLVSAYEWADRFDEALQVMREIVKDDPKAGFPLAIDFAREHDKDELVREFSEAMEDEPCFKYWGNLANVRQIKTPSYVLERAEACVLNNEKPLKTRVVAFQSFFGTDVSARGEKVLQALEAVPVEAFKKVPFSSKRAIERLYASGAWARTVRLIDLVEKVGGQVTTVHERLRILALANLGEKDRAAKCCDRVLQAGTLNEADTLRFKFLAAMIRGEAVEKLLEGTKLSAHEQVDVIKSAGRFAQIMEMPDYAEALAKTYDRYFKPQPRRSLAVTYSKKQIRSIADWRAIYPTLPKAYCNLPFKVDEAALINDVNTERTMTEKKDGDNLTAQVEITTVCDRSAIHLFMRVADKTARKVEYGVVNGIPMELYFAPGENQPYICFGSDPVKGVTFLMNTQYDSLRAHRIQKDKTLRSAVDFTDDDYVLHVALDWSSFYDKLPKAGDYWKFDCMAWAPGGRMTWGGSRGPHHSSDWGHLTFALTPQELTEIRRELLLKNYKSWRKLTWNGTTTRPADIVDFWNDEVVGDPQFYATTLKPFLDELTAAAARVNPEMDDKTVNEVFEKALPKWMGLKHEIDALRKVYLSNQLMQSF